LHVFDATSAQADVKALISESAARVAELVKTDNVEGLYVARRTFAEHERSLGRLKRDEKSRRAAARGTTAVEVAV
jgi:hypothetical protein